MPASVELDPDVAALLKRDQNGLPVAAGSIAPPSADNTFAVLP